VLKEFPLKFAAEGNQMISLRDTTQISIKMNLEETTPAS
jgi:hypothetical protein